MGRHKNLTPKRRAFINSLIAHYQPHDAVDVQDMLKDLLEDTLQGMLELRRNFVNNLEMRLLV